ncbi:MAG: 4Fe-4S dicluster domain-containing protein [Oscillospiraceae bacterium]
MLHLFSKQGILLEQNKEPALSREVQVMTQSDCEETFLQGNFPINLAMMTPERIVEFASFCEIYDDSDDILLSKKLSSKNASAIVVDSINDEPYVSNRLCPTLHLTQELLNGIEIAAKALGVQQKYIAIYKNLMDVEIKIPKMIGTIPVKKITGRYPVEFRIADHFKEEKKIITIGAGSLIHLSRAFKNGKKQNSVFITVAGNCISTPCNMEVTIGTPVSAVLKACGLMQNPNCLILGGPMTGFSITDVENEVITRTTEAVLAIKQDSSERNYSCIGCGKCVDACPENINPYYIFQAIKRNRTSKLGIYNVNKCINCGACSYVCPAKLPLARIIYGYKKSVL